MTQDISRRDFLSKVGCYSAVGATITSLAACDSTEVNGDDPDNGTSGVTIETATPSRLISPTRVHSD